MKILTEWLRSYLPALSVDDAQLAEDLTLRGIAVEGIHALDGGRGSLFEMDITTNRVDAMNHYGIAREAAAIYDLPLPPLDTTLPAAIAADQPFPVRIDAPQHCGRFTAQVIRGITVGTSSGLLAQYFTDLGQKPISDAVDISNDVLLGMGQPNHAYDLDRIEGGLVARMAHPGETLKLIDGKTRTLTADDLVIADERKALGLAGVMGGWDSMITAETKNVLVEVAWFDPATVRASSRRHLLHTDASHRYERGADFGAVPIASALVTKAILATCGGQRVGEMVDVLIPELQQKTETRAPIQLSAARTAALLGQTIAPEGISASLIARFLTALGCTLKALDEDLFEVTLPSWRLDLEREIDLIEEVARVYGYNGFRDTLPAPGVVVAHPLAAAERAVRSRLLALGFSEAVSSSFTSVADAQLFAPDAGAVPLENPLNDEASAMRPSLLPGMLTMLAHNLNRDVAAAALFERGSRFRGVDPKQPAAEVDERISLALGLTGASAATPLYAAADVPFYTLKGALTSLLSLFDTPVARFSPEGIPPAFEPGRSAALHLGTEGPIAFFGQLSTAETTRRKLRQPVFLAELDLTSLLTCPLRQPTARELSRFQAVERDFSFILAEQTTWQQIISAIEALNISELQSVRAVEIFRDAARLPGKSAMLIRTVFQAPRRTLEEADLSTWSAAIIQAVEALGGQLRTS